MSGNEKRKKFKQLAEYRTEQAIHYISLIGNLSNTRAYQYSEKDVNIIMSALRAAVKQSSEKFKNGSGKKTTFKLD